MGALNQAWSRREEIAPHARLGFYSGWLGVAYARMMAAESLHQEDQSLPALELIESLARAEFNPLALDVISGSAGAIPMLLELHRRCEKNWLIELAIRHGEHLLNTARKRDVGWSWKTLEIPTRDDLTGFSLGTSGIAWALLELYEVTGDPRWRSAAEEAFRYERRWFNPQEGNWADLRVFDQAAAMQSPTPPCSMAWCHGAPGIALALPRAGRERGGTSVCESGVGPQLSARRGNRRPARNPVPSHPARTLAVRCAGWRRNALALARIGWHRLFLSALV
jgi:lantibiotic modifying enzyme